MTDESKIDLSEMKSNLLATMSHEMRTPMQSVFGFLELMLFENPSPKLKSMIEAAMNSASGVLEILDDILDVAKIDADKMELERLEIPLRTLVRGVLEALEPKVMGKNLELIDDVSEAVPKVVIGDPKRLRQILINLAGNAVKFTSEGSITIRVGVESYVPLKLRFEVVDTGIGMSEDVQKKLFQPFTQADGSTSREFGGTGLGLSISRKLVELMGGEIGVTSQIGRGTNFWFTVPSEEVLDEMLDWALPDLAGLSILSVEDHPQAAREIVSSLVSMGARVESCRTVKETIAMLKHRPFDVVVADQGLEDGLGIDVIRNVSEHWPQTGLVMYTARDDAGLKQSLSALGAFYLEKPASRRGLGEAVMQMAARKSVESPDKNGKILVVEDTETVRDMFALQFEVLGGDVEFAENGLEALDMLKQREYHLVLSDLHMPKMDGYGLIKKIRELEEGTETRMPVVLLTADIQMSSSRTYMPLGFDECLLKPVSLGSLRQMLVRWGVPMTRNPDQRMVGSPELRTGSIDMDVLKSQMGEIDAAAADMLARFPDMMRPLLKKLIEECDKINAAELREVAHSMKGAARSAGAMRLGDLAEQIQANAEQGVCDKQACSAFEREFAQVETDLSALCAKFV